MEIDCREPKSYSVLRFDGLVAVLDPNAADHTWSGAVILSMLTADSYCSD